MLLRSGPLPTTGDWAFEPKWDGFRAIVSTEQGLEVRSRRGWNMADRVPELAELPGGVVLDGELIALNDAGEPHWPLLCRRVLHGDTTIAVTFVAFDVLRVEGQDVTCRRWSERRAVLEQLNLHAPCSRLSEAFDDGEALFQAVVEHGLEGVVAKRRNGLYRPGYRGWTKVKNPGYWRREAEAEGMQRRRARAA